MRVIKKINNNVVVAMTDKDEERIIRGKGLGFEKIPFEIDNNSPRIEAIYIPRKDTTEMLLSERLSEDIINLTKEIVKTGGKILNKEFHGNIYLSLADHISYALERYDDHLEIKNPLHWEIKNIYPNEYRIGLKALEIIYSRTKIELPESEASFIALHFVNALIDDCGFEETTKLTKIIGEIINIIKYHYSIDLDEDSMVYNRFVTHVRYFVIRQMKGIVLKEDDNQQLFNVIKSNYSDEMDCVAKINHHLFDNYGWNCTDDEMLYLVLHLQRLKNNLKDCYY